MLIKANKIHRDMTLNKNILNIPFVLIIGLYAKKCWWCNYQKK